MGKAAVVTVHFVYNKGAALKTPDTILFELSRHLARHFHLKTYSIGERGTITPAPGDILLGHPSRYTQDSIFNRSFEQEGWTKRIIFCPFSHAMPRDAAAIDPLVEKADHYLALCGPYWFDTMEDSLLSHWRYKTMRCDLGINRTAYPLTKIGFNPPGQRRFLYIGNAGPMKGVDFFCALAEANPNLSFSWIGWQGPGQRPPGTLRREYGPLEHRLRSGPVVTYGGANWRDQASTDLATSHDFLLTCGRSDSNPTTILEATAWGLVPVAPVQCGYYGDDWLLNIPLDDIAGASAMLNTLNMAPEAELIARRTAGLARLDSHYTWAQAADQVMACISAPAAPAPVSAEWRARKQTNQKALADLMHHYRRDQSIEDALHAVIDFPRAAAAGVRQALGQ